MLSNDPFNVGRASMGIYKSVIRPLEPSNLFFFLFKKFFFFLDVSKHYLLENVFCGLK